MAYDAKKESRDTPALGLISECPGRISRGLLRGGRSSVRHCVLLAALAYLFAPPIPAGADEKQGGFFAESTAAQKVAQPIRDAIASIRSLERSGVAPLDFRAVSTDLVHVNSAGEIQIYVVLTEFQPKYATQLESIGLRVELTLPDVRLIQGWALADVVDLIARYDFVTEVKPPGYPVPRHG